MSAAASSDSILAPAAGASVAVRDHSGSQSLVDGLSNIYGQADESGKYEFDYTLPDKNKAPEIDTTVELDGYKTTAPVFASGEQPIVKGPVSYTHLRAHETRHDLVCRLLLEKKKK